MKPSHNHTAVVQRGHNETLQNKTYETKKVFREAQVQLYWLLLISVSFYKGICRGHYCLTQGCKVWFSAFTLKNGIGKIYGRQLICAGLFV